MLFLPTHTSPKWAVSKIDILIFFQLWKVALVMLKVILNYLKIYVEVDEKSKC